MQESRDFGIDRRIVSDAPFATGGELAASSEDVERTEWVGGRRGGGGTLVAVLVSSTCT